MLYRTDWLHLKTIVRKQENVKDDKHFSFLIPKDSNKKYLMISSTTISIEGIGPVLLERSARAKRLNITIKPFKGVRVAVPTGVPFKVAEKLTRAKSKWLSHHIPRIKELEKIYEKASLNTITLDKKEASKVLKKKLEEIAAIHGYSYNRISFRNQKTRWGSCSSNNNISLNIKLTLLPNTLRDFILLHELVHTKVKNHGKGFWAEIMKAEPRARELAKQVNQQNIQLL
jgi:predicted metal-dependent hydrolase